MNIRVWLLSMMVAAGLLASAPANAQSMAREAREHSTGCVGGALIGGLGGYVATSALAMVIGPAAPITMAATAAVGALAGCLVTVSYLNSSNRPAIGIH